MKIPYTYLEVEAIEHDYEEQVPLNLIAESVNRDFHNGKQIRSKQSVSYVINKLKNDDEWRNRLEMKWLNTIQ
ncbi:hypothetical protein [Brevibacillus brevis]|uniref:hypothetical protein n=1 Tax=Brevibacillus brevis TaxID=1393 RepID=UPI0007D8B578|nr:hypothetical protein [Brevibacillus brevis]